MSRKEQKDPFTVRPPASVVAAIKRLAEEDGIATERAMGAYCLRGGVALRALASSGHAGLSDEQIEASLLPYLVPLLRFLRERGLLDMLGARTEEAAPARSTETPVDAIDEDLAAMRAAADELASFMEM